MKHLLIVGHPGVGKTTLVKHLSRALKAHAIDGFVTEELREHEQRMGFWLSPLDGRQVVLAHRHLDAGVRVGPYLVNPSVLDEVAVPVIQRGMRRAVVLFVDELGKMELCSRRFERAVHEALDRGPSVVATAGVAEIPFLEMIKRRRDVELIPFSRVNRDAIAEELRARLETLCAEDEAVRSLQQQADHICELIVSGDVPQIDIEIRQTRLRDAVARTFPDRHALYQLIYESRFRRLWQQFRHSSGA